MREAGTSAYDRATSRPSGPRSRIDRLFGVSQRGSSVRTELIAGLATWLTMAYILFVNPAVLGSVPDPSGVRLPFDQLLTVTALTAGVMTIAIGVFGRVPFAMAAGLGLNAFVAFTLVGQVGLSWPDAMGVIVLEGIAITILVLTGFREAVFTAIPADLKRAIAIGIGLFIAFIGFVNAGIVVHPGSGTPIVTLASDLASLKILVFVVGLTIAAVLVARRTIGALLIAILVSTAVAIVLNEVFAAGPIWPGGVATLPKELVATPDFGLVGAFSISGVFQAVPVLTALALVLSVMLSDFFDTMGTVVGLGEEAGILDERGRLPRLRNILLVDSLGAVAGGATSSSSNTAYIEAAAGISEGGRTGLTSVIVGVLFLVAIVFAPVAGVIPPEATAPVLVIVGYFLFSGVRDISWGDPGIGIPALLTIVLMPFTFSITNGVGAGFIAYTTIAVCRGRWREVHPLLYAVSAVFVWYFIRGVT